MIRTFYKCIETHTSGLELDESKFYSIGDSEAHEETGIFPEFLWGADVVEKISDVRYGNRSKVRMEIRYGKDDSLFKLEKVYIDYLKAPQFIRLTQEQVDVVADTSQILEFPDYVCQEIVNELVKLLMENGSDPRLQTNIPVNQSIANPAQEQPQRGR